MVEYKQPQTVIVSQEPLTGEWKHGTWSCCESCGDCWFAFCCGPCYSYTAAQAAGEDSSMSIIVCLAPYLTGIPAIGLCCLRENIRKRRGIQGSSTEDFLCTCCCSCCSIIQMKREFTD